MSSRQKFFVLLLSLLISSLACNLITDTGEETSALATVPPPRSTVAPASGSEPAPQSTGATYYVGRHSCNDAGPGSEAHPFCSIGIALAALRPGDTLVILKGTYTNRLVVNSIAGTGNAPITIRGESAESVVFDGGCPGFPCGVNDVSGEWDDDEMGMVMLTDSSHFVLRDLTVQNVIAVGVAVMGGNDIWVENITIHGTGHAGMLFKYLSGLTVAGNDIGFIQHGWKDENDDVQVGAHESLSVVGVEDFTVRDNTVHDSLKEGIDIKESATNGEATNNFVERTCLVGIYINEAQQVTVRDNQVRAAGYFLTGDGEEDLCRNQPTFGDLYGRYYGGGIQVAVGDLGDLSTGRLSDLILVRNVVWNSVGNGLEFWDELEESGQGDGTMTDIQVHNNVFYNTTFAGIRLEDAQNVTIANNILMLNAEAPLTGDMVGSSTLSHNLFFPVEGTAGNHPVTVDPLFVNPVGGDFHLQPDSPAIDAGLDVGLPYTGNAPDMGAYEFSAGGSETRSDGAVRLTTPPAGGSDQNPAFAPDDSQMVFTRFDNGYNDGPAGLFLLDMAAFTPGRLTSPEDQDNVNLPGSAWNALNNRIVFASDRAEADDLWRIAPDGSDFSRITTHSDAGIYLEPSWSPDGQWLVFEISLPGASEDGRIGKIWKIRVDGSGLTPLTSDAQFDDRQPNWSPAGDRILFQRRSLPDGDWDIYTIATDGSGLLNVTNAPDASDTDASWSPDGERIVYSSDFDGLSTANIFTISAGGGFPSRMTTSTNEDSAPSWSPDGKWIAFESHVVNQTAEGPAALWRIAIVSAETFLPLIVTPVH